MGWISHRNICITYTDILLTDVLRGDILLADVLREAMLLVDIDSEQNKRDNGPTTE